MLDLEQLIAKESDPRRIRALERYVPLINAGLTNVEIARRLGIGASAVHRTMKILGLRQAKKPPAVKDPQAIARDLHTLTTAGGYSQEQALAIINRPKRKLTWRAPA